MLSDGRAVVGLFVKQSDSELISQPVGWFADLAEEGDIESRSLSQTSIMPADIANQLASRQQFLDLVRYLIEIRDGGMRGPGNCDLLQRRFALALPEYETHLDHAGLLRGLDRRSLERGQAIYDRLCADCHGTHDAPGSLPRRCGLPRDVQERQRSLRDVSNAHARVRPDDAADVDGAAAKIRRDSLHPRSILRHAIILAVCRDHQGIPEPLAEGGHARAVAELDRPWATMDYGPA